MGANTDSYYLRRKSGTAAGNAVGPFSPQVLTTMLKKGTLDGSEEISRDRRNWFSVKDVERAPAPATPPTPPPPPLRAPPPPRPRPSGAAEADPGFSPNSTEVLSMAGAQMIMHNPPGGPDGARGAAELDIDTDFGPPAPSAPAPVPGRNGTAGGIGPPGLRISSPALQSSGSPSAGLSVRGESAGNAFELDASDLIPLELAPLDPVASKSSTVPRLGALAPTPARDAAAPVVILLADSDGLGFDQTEALGSVPLLPTVRPDTVSPGGPGDAPRATAQINAARHRTMSAVRQRPAMAAPPPRSRKKLVTAVAGGAAVIAVGAFLALGGVGLIAGEPTIDAVLGSVATEIDQDHFPAYEAGAKLLIEAAATRPKSVRLRAGAAELLASSVVLRRAERGRIAKAEAILAEVSGGRESMPELARARGWIALAKGNIKEASRLAIASADDARTGLLFGWTQIADGKAASAIKTFEDARTRLPERAALRYGLGRAQEDAGLPAALTTYQALLTESGWHFGAGLAVIRSSNFPPAARITLVETLISKQAADASRTELADAQVLIARAARLIGRGERADAELKQALALDPADPSAQVASGEALLDQGRMKEAIAKFKLAAPNAPVGPVAAPLQGLRCAMAAILIEEGKAKPALALLDAVANTDPRGHFWRARAAELASPPDLEAARRGYEETLKLDPRFVPATLQLAALLVQQQRGNEGLAVLKRAEAAGAPASALQLALGQAFLASGDIDRAKKTFTEVLTDNPKLAAARMGLAAALKVGGDLGGARTELETLLAKAPDTPGLRQSMAELMIALGQKDQALATYQAEITGGRASPALKMAAARLALDTGHADVGRDIAEKIVAENPETPGSLVLLGRIRRALGDLPGAVAELRRALAFESTPELHYEYGRALLDSGSTEEALNELEQAPSMAAASLERARIFLRRGDAERAVGPLEMAVKQAPNNGDAWLLLGNAYDRLGTPARAEAAWRSASRTDPAAPEPHYRLGRLLMDQGQVGPALVQLRQAAPRVPATGAWTADFYFQLGYAEKARGTRPAAAAALKKYLAIAPADAPSRHEVEQQLGSL